MLYIAVFTLFSIPVAKGYASLIEAINCLDQAYNDSDSLPLGIYDANMVVVVSSQHENPLLAYMNEDLIIRIAQSYIERIA